MNTSTDEVCPICKTKEDKPVVLVGMDGTQKDRIIQAIQVHVDCIDLLIQDMGDFKFIYQKVPK
jgi:hypothetical protein